MDTSSVFLFLEGADPTEGGAHVGAVGLSSVLSSPIALRKLVRSGRKQGRQAQFIAMDTSMWVRIAGILRLPIRLETIVSSGPTQGLKT